MENKIFKKEVSLRLKEEGMEAAAKSNYELLELARREAKEIAKCNFDETCDADQVGMALLKKHNISSLGPVAGSIFREPCWEWTGEFVKSSRITNHARNLYVWKLKN